MYVERTFGGREIAKTSEESRRCVWSQVWASETD